MFSMLEGFMNKLKFFNLILKFDDRGCFSNFISYFQINRTTENEINLSSFTSIENQVFYQMNETPEPIPNRTNNQRDS